MAIGSGLSASLGIATETTPGTPVPVTRFVEFDSETLAVKKHTVQGDGLRQGGLVRRAQRRFDTSREVTGDVAFAPATNGLGIWLQHMLGSFTAVPQSIGGGLYRQVHNIGSLQGKAFTAQVLRPDTTGNLAQSVFTYPGCKVTTWELSVAQGAEVKLKVGIDALDEATPSNAFAATTTTAAATAGGTTISTAGAVPAGSYVIVDSGLTAEVAQVASVAGTANPYTLTLAAPLTQPHATGVQVASATGLNYGAATALQTATYPAAAGLFTYLQGRLVAGGTTSSASGIWTNTGGTTVANVRSATLSGKNALKVDRWGLGSAVRSEQLENGYRDYTASLELDYNGRTFYDAYVAGVPMALQLSFTTPAGAVLSAYAPVGFQEDGAQASVSGPDVLQQKLSTTLLDDAVNGSLQFVYVSTDAAV